MGDLETSCANHLLLAGKMCGDRCILPLTCCASDPVVAPCSGSSVCPSDGGMCTSKCPSERHCLPHWILHTPCILWHVVVHHSPTSRQPAFDTNDPRSSC